MYTLELAYFAGKIAKNRLVCKKCRCIGSGKSSWVKVQIPDTRVIIVGQKYSTNDQTLPRADLWRQISHLCPASPHPLAAVR